MERQDSIPHLSHHVVICNGNEKVRQVVRELWAGTQPDPVDVVLVVQDDALWQSHPEWCPEADPPHAAPEPSGSEARSGRFWSVSGCATDPADLDRVGISRARAALILADPNQGLYADARSALVAIAIERHNPQVHTVMELISSQNRRHLMGTEVNEVVCLGDLSEKLIAQSCITPGVKNILGELLTSANGTHRLFVRALPPPLWGQTYRQIVRAAILSGVPYVVCGFVQGVGISLDGDRAAGTLVLNPQAEVSPGKETALTSDDRLVLMALEPPGLVDLQP